MNTFANVKFYFKTYIYSVNKIVIPFRLKLFSFHLFLQFITFIFTMFMCYVSPAVAVFFPVLNVKQVPSLCYPIDLLLLWFLCQSLLCVRRFYQVNEVFFSVFQGPKLLKIKANISIYNFYCLKAINSSFSLPVGFVAVSF